MSKKLKLLIPRDLKQIVEEKFKGWKYVDAFENFSLLLSRFCPFWEENGELEKPKYDLFGYEIRLPENAVRQYSLYFEQFKELLKDVHAITFEMVTKSRLVIGLGDESVYETSIRLHRNYGVPYIPGSALKGVAKHYAFSILAEEAGEVFLDEFKDVKNEMKRKIAKRERVKEKDILEDYYLAVAVIQELFERKFDRLEEIDSLSVKVGDINLSIKDLIEIFGTQKQEGFIIFFDAFPVPDQLKNKPILELDIMNPHYQPYYQHGEVPGDWCDSKPIFFLTVPAGIKFQFALASRNRNQNLLKEAKKLLVEALENYGVGAKTSLGYGRFD